MDFVSPRDDGTKPTFFSRLADRAFKALQPPKEPLPASLAVSEEREPMPDLFGEEEELPVEFRICLPAGATYPVEAMAHFLTTLSPGQIRNSPRTTLPRRNGRNRNEMPAKPMCRRKE